ncbi:hypothetical protein Hanom_Chr01g00050151 [Helianthus anomalus]
MNTDNRSRLRRAPAPFEQANTQAPHHPTPSTTFIRPLLTELGQPAEPESFFQRRFTGDDSPVIMTMMMMFHVGGMWVSRQNRRGCQLRAPTAVIQTLSPVSRFLFNPSIFGHCSFFQV